MQSDDDGHYDLKLAALKVWSYSTGVRKLHKSWLRNRNVEDGYGWLWVRVKIGTNRCGMFQHERQVHPKNQDQPDR